MNKTPDPDPEPQEPELPSPKNEPAATNSALGVGVVARMNDPQLVDYQPGKIITLELPVPPSANRYWRHSGRGVYRSTEAKQYIETLQWQAKAWGIEPLTGRVKYFANYSIRASRDLGNNGKVLQDALQGIVYQNDGQIDEIHEHRKPFKNGGSVWVVVSAL